MVYLDNAATTKVSDEVISEMNDYHLINYANPSSKHIFGKKIKTIIENSRKKIADFINCNNSEIYFNSGSTEGINTILRGYVEANIEKGGHIITTKTEHKAVLETCAYLETIGIEVTYLDVDKNGLIDLKELENSINERTLLVSILWVNNETGIIQALSEISKIVSKTNSKLFVDATQAVGKITVNVKSIDVDMLCFSAHKFHGPKGIGVLYIKKGISINPLLYGGGQEKGIRSGTNNVPGIVGLAKACEISNTKNTGIENVMQYLEDKLKKKFDCKIVGEEVKRSPYISNIIFRYIDADVIIGKLKHTIISSGSACTSEIIEPSHVLRNMGVSENDAFRSLRFSISMYTTITEIETSILELESLLKI